ncbi:Glyoxalase-like domain protein [Gimesia chilikensis]|uniref:Bleomycin resistance protein n=1 Tax=Gimesia chilikensis TaxID=2605989 RepID=A0A517WLZ3_9PLAN|nr:glyoxalase superfamily protein [Gimesia chilikensis]QDU06263.1 Glyoxalase-like domain protein [Gimesia chilikensis]
MSDPKTESEYGFEIRSSIPVLRMFDEVQAKEFYLDYLGFEVDWESRFFPTAPLYVQIHLGESILHLNGHAKEDAPITEVNIPVRGLQNFCDYLISKQAEYPKPIPVDPRYQGRNTDLNLYDPFGNLLVFCSQTTEG